MQVQNWVYYLLNNMKIKIKILSLVVLLGMLILPTIALFAKEKIDAEVTFDNMYYTNTSVSGQIFNPGAANFKLAIEYGETDNFGQKTGLIPISSTGSFYLFPIKNLKPNTTYKYRLFDTTGTLDPADTASFTAFKPSSDGITYNLDDFTGGTTTSPGSDNTSGGNGNTTNTTTGDGTTTTIYNNGGLVLCGTQRAPYSTDSKGAQTGGNILNPCDFHYLLIMVNYIINFVFKYMVVPVAAILFAYAGFELITSGGSPEQRGKALNVFKNVGIGLVISAASWLIVSLILSILGFSGSWIGF